jgi:hypothetical protein
MVGTDESVVAIMDNIIASRYVPLSGGSSSGGSSSGGSSSGGSSGDDPVIRS